jgi:hypothetical protein
MTIDSTCFSIGLNLVVSDAHKRVTCDKCLNVLSRKKGILTDDMKNTNNSDRADFFKCEQPWDPVNEDHREDRKDLRYNDLISLFDKKPPPTPPPPRQRQPPAKTPGSHRR